MTEKVKSINCDTKVDNSKEIEINLFMEDKIISKIFLDKDSTLREIRKNISNLLKNSNCFTLRNTKIEKDDEDTLRLKDILIGNNVYIKSYSEQDIERGKKSSDDYQINVTENSYPSKNSELKEKDEDTEKPINGCILLSKRDNAEIQYFLIKPISNIIEDPDKNYYIYNHDIFTQEEKSKSIVILFIGQTGDGKTTLINALINIIFGIKINNNFRYKLINENSGRTNSQSQTTRIHIHNIKTKEGTPLTLVDTQGFGDTRGFHYDEKLIKNFMHLFHNEIDHINFICLILNSMEDRLTIGKEYFFSRVGSIFAKGLEKNFIYCFTKYDGDGEPAIISIIKKEKGSIKNKVENLISLLINNEDSSCYYLLDNKIIIDDCINRKSHLNQERFEQTKKELEKFYDKILKSISVSSTKTSTMLDLLFQNEKYIDSLFNQIKKIQDKNFAIDKERKLITENNKKKISKDTEINKINSHINFLYSELSECNSNLCRYRRILKEKQNTVVYYEAVVYRKEKKIFNSCGSHKVCPDCKSNCHKYCNCWLWCDAMENNYCKVCGCRESKHIKVNWYYDETTKKDYEYRTRREDRSTCDDTYRIEREESKIKDKKKKIDIENNKIYSIQKEKNDIDSNIRNNENKIRNYEYEIENIKSNVLSIIENVKKNMIQIKKKSLNDYNDEILENSIKALLEQKEFQDISQDESKNNMKLKLKEINIKKLILSNKTTNVDDYISKIKEIMDI